MHGFLHPNWYTSWKFNHSTLGPNLPGPKEKDRLPSIIYSGGNCLTSRVYIQLSGKLLPLDPKNPPKDTSEMIRENEGNVSSHHVVYIVPLGHWLNHIPQNELIPFGKLDDFPCRKRNHQLVESHLMGQELKSLGKKTHVLSISKAPQSEIVL